MKNQHTPIITGNRIAVTNERDETTSMGVFTDNVPFVGMIAIAVISGAIGFMKLRKIEEYEDA